MATNFVSTFTRMTLIGLLIIGLWLYLHPEQGYACSCPSPGSPSEELAESAAVFMGQVVSVRELERDDGKWGTEDPTTVEFKVDTVWKGSASETMYLTTSRSEVSCGFTFVESLEYVVYSRDGSTVSLCSRTRLLSEAPFDLAQLGKGQEPTQGTIAPTPDVSEYQTGGGCGLSPHTTDLSVAGVIAGIAWLGLRKRRH